MSFDICVFHASAAPRKPIDFVEWFNQTTDWELNKEYDNDAVCQPDLKEWYHCMLKHYPAMNGRDCESSRQAYLISHPEIAGDDAELIVDDMTADYCLTPDLIYAAFNWDFAENVYKLSRDEAFRLGLGFFDLTDNCVEFSPTESIRLPNEEEKEEENLPLTETVDINTPVEQSHTPKGIERFAFRNQRMYYALFLLPIMVLVAIFRGVRQGIASTDTIDGFLYIIIFSFIFLIATGLFIMGVIGSHRLKHRTGCYFLNEL